MFTCGHPNGGDCRDGSPKVVVAGSSCDSGPGVRVRDRVRDRGPDRRPMDVVSTASDGDVDAGPITHKMHVKNSSRSEELTSRIWIGIGNRGESEDWTTVVRRHLHLQRRLMLHSLPFVIVLCGLISESKAIWRRRWFPMFACSTSTREGAEELMKHISMGPGAIFSGNSLSLRGCVWQSPFKDSAQFGVHVPEIAAKIWGVSATQSGLSAYLLATSFNCMSR